MDGEHGVASPAISLADEEIEAVYDQIEETLEPRKNGKTKANQMKRQRDADRHKAWRLKVSGLTEQQLDQLVQQLMPESRPTPAFACYQKTISERKGISVHVYVRYSNARAAQTIYNQFRLPGVKICPAKTADKAEVERMRQSDTIVSTHQLYKARATKQNKKQALTYDEMVAHYESAFNARPMGCTEEELIANMSQAHLGMQDINDLF